MKRPMLLGGLVFKARKSTIYKEVGDVNGLKLMKKSSMMVKSLDGPGWHHNKKQNYSTTFHILDDQFIEIRPFSVKSF